MNEMDLVFLRLTPANGKEGDLLVKASKISAMEKNTIGGTDLYIELGSEILERKVEESVDEIIKVLREIYFKLNKDKKLPKGINNKPIK